MRIEALQAAGAPNSGFDFFDIGVMAVRNIRLSGTDRAGLYLSGNHT
ncbi:hypothetical protein [Telmatospirillum siberiense]|nr:hypothetical protein [Telmatospirillum siberiense]